MKSIEKDIHHYILAILLAVFIVTDLKVPPTVDELVNTLLGKVIVIGAGLALLFAHPMLGVLGVIAAYRLISQAESVGSAPASNVPASPVSNVVPQLKKLVKPVKAKKLSPTNQFPVTVEEEVIRKMLPMATPSQSPPSYKPILDKLHDAAKISS